MSGGGAVVVEEVEADLTGNVLGQYALERIVGEGAMGRVYLGRHQRIGRVGAVKVLKEEHARSTEHVQRFIQEAQAVNAIKNEHIVEIYDFGEVPVPGRPPRIYCVMELLDGLPLADVMEQGPMPVPRAVRICLQLATALQAAHDVGVVHRDVKPENVFLHKKGADADFVKVLDFGVAKLLKPIGDLPKVGTAAGVVLGTPEYMAPEQAMGLPTDERVDVYATGLVLYELLAGMAPFRAPTFGKLVVEITSRPVPPLPPRTMGGEPIPEGLAQVVKKCLAKEPADRWASAAALAAALAPYATPGALGAGPPSAPALSSSAAAPSASAAPSSAGQASPTAAATAPAPDAGPASKASPVPKLLGAVGLLLALLAAAYFVARG